MINISDLLAKNNAKPHSVSGYWFLIQWSPDSYSMERFNIGVGFANDKGAREVRLCNSARMLSNWYGKNLSKQLDLIKKIAKHRFIKNPPQGSTDNYFVENGIHYLPMGFAQGETVEAVLNLLYKDVVVMHGRNNENEREKYTTTHRVISLVKDAISEKDDLKVIMPDNPMIETTSGIAVKVPIQYKNNAGTIVSADYGTSESVENELLRSFRDIDLILSENEFSNVNSFLLLPASQKREAHKIDNLVGDYISSLKTKGVATLTAHQPSSLVQEIDEWYKKVA
ncbi:hypothetical protein SMY33_001416 [Cronobacter malonaticus]|nr:hypothetical protein [Cronobacter malonaticus]ELY4416464.1 hypothetical protein [Cronobacter sakazakii]EMC4134603.1 hypothetical protein [Cronobacter sakazakii]